MTHTRTYTLEERALEALCSQEPVRIVDIDKIGRVHAIRSSQPGDPRSGNGHRTIDVIDLNGHDIYHVSLGFNTVEWGV